MAATGTRGGTKVAKDGRDRDATRREEGSQTWLPRKQEAGRWAAIDGRDGDAMRREEGSQTWLPRKQGAGCRRPLMAETGTLRGGRKAAKHGCHGNKGAKAAKDGAATGTRGGM